LFILAEQKVEYYKRMREDLKKKDKEKKFVEHQQLGAKRIKQKTKWKADNMVGRIRKVQWDIL